MTNHEILSHIDYTLLRPTASWEEIQTLCNEALEYETASVCVPACYVKKIREAYPKLVICTVIGFPLGYHTTAVKLFETKEAIAEGADEIDMVINLTAVKNGDLKEVESEIRAVKQATAGHILKVIIETCYLSEAEKVLLCKAVSNAGADYIKTSTGFGAAGAQIEDIRLFRAEIAPGVKIKAAGGIRSKEAMELFLEAGADRLGSSTLLK